MSDRPSIECRQCRGACELDRHGEPVSTFTPPWEGTYDCRHCRGTGRVDAEDACDFGWITTAEFDRIIEEQDA